MSAFDVVALGETMLCLAPPGGSALAYAESLEVDIAGAESNTCIGLQRSGLATAWVSRVGDDPFGERILRVLGDEGVDTRFVRVDPERLTGVMVKDPARERPRYYRGTSAASVLEPSDLDGVPVEQARAVLVTGVTGLIGAGPQRAALRLLERGTGLRVFDPNLRPGLWGSDRVAELLRPLLAASNLVLGGIDELATVVGGDSLEEVATRVLAEGPDEVVVKHGTPGAYVVTRDGRRHEIETIRLDTIDPIGAGDAFNAGYLAARLADDSIEDALARATACGTAVAASAGDWAGFPRG
jgi:2-dehydro-3-deoxygluconokinase